MRKCSECSHQNVCLYCERFREFIHGAPQPLGVSIAGLVSTNDDNPESYDRLMDWYDTFAQFCPIYRSSNTTVRKKDEA